MKRMFGKKKGDKSKDGKKSEKRKTSAEGQKKAESEAQSTEISQKRTFFMRLFDLFVFFI